MTVERYPNLKEGVSGSIPNYEISSLLNKTYQVVNCLVYFGTNMLAFYLKKEKKKKKANGHEPPSSNESWIGGPS